VLEHRSRCRTGAIILVVLLSICFVTLEVALAMR